MQTPIVSLNLFASHVIIHYLQTIVFLHYTVQIFGKHYETLSVTNTFTIFFIVTSSLQVYCTDFLTAYFSRVQNLYE